MSNVLNADNYIYAIQCKSVNKDCISNEPGQTANVDLLIYTERPLMKLFFFFLINTFWIELLIKGGKKEKRNMFEFLFTNTAVTGIIC